MSWSIDETPWLDRPYGDLWIRIEDDADHTIAQLPALPDEHWHDEKGDDCNPPTLMARARLIAAAPQLAAELARVTAQRDALLVAANRVMDWTRDTRLTWGEDVAPMLVAAIRAVEAPDA